MVSMMLYALSKVLKHVGYDTWQESLGTTMWEASSIVGQASIL